MSDSVSIALDAMGGDYAPESVIAGAALALRKYPELTFCIFGDTYQLQPFLDLHQELKSTARLIHTEEHVTAEDKPVTAVRQKRHSSMRLAINAVSTGEAQAVISSGNTGAYMAMSHLVLRPLKGINRTAIAKAMPTLTGYAVVLDLGANAECTAQNLYEFAIMGRIYAQVSLNIPNPSVGILNIGTEDLKGSSIVQEAARLLKSSRQDLNFQGFVEGNDLSSGRIDVIVTDGFTGNVALKTAEGTVHLFATFLKEALKKNWRTKLGAALAKPGLRGFASKIDPRNYNGAIFLGLNGVAVKSHGNTDAVGFAHAVGVAYDLVKNKAILRIEEALSKIKEA